MNVQEFTQAFGERTCFTSRDAYLRFPELDGRQFRRWQASGWVKQLRKPYYRIAFRTWTVYERWAAANAVYAPSYVSLETALGHYGFIPEGVFQITSITTRHTRSFEIEGMRHSYRNVLPAWFFGYTLLEQGQVVVRMAGPEKCLLDVLHFNRDLRGPADFEAMRFDRIGICEAIDPAVWQGHLSLSTNQALHRRARAFQRWLQ